MSDWVQDAADRDHRRQQENAQKIEQMREKIRTEGQDDGGR